MVKDVERQVTDLQIRVSILYRFTQLGMPEPANAKRQLLKSKVNLACLSCWKISIDPKLFDSALVVDHDMNRTGIDFEVRIFFRDLKFASD